MKKINVLAAIGILAAGSFAGSSFGAGSCAGSFEPGSLGTSSFAASSCAARPVGGRQVHVAPASAKLYDPARDPERDLGDAIIQASWSGKRILLEVGGDWCIWCHRLEEFVENDRGLVHLRDTNFILVKVNYSQENTNEAFLSKYPKIPGFPHIFVLSPDGKFLYSEGTSELEHGESYDRQRVAAFFKKWAPR